MKPTFIPNPDNPRAVTTERLDLLRKQLAEFGDLSGIVSNRRTGHLVGGHQRLAVFRDAKMEPKVVKSYSEPTPAGTVAEGFITVDGERFVYREVDWDQGKERLAMIAANNAAGQWEEAGLRKLMAEIDAGELELTGFDRAEMARLLKEVSDDPMPMSGPDGNSPIKHQCPNCGHEWAGKPA